MGGPGAIAQLEERLVCIQKARGSNSPLAPPRSEAGCDLEGLEGEPKRLPSALWRLLRAVGTAKVRSTATRQTAPGSAPSRSAGVRTASGSGARSPAAPRPRSETSSRSSRPRPGPGFGPAASYTLAKAVDDWAAEALDDLAPKTVRSHVDLLKPVTMLIGNIPLRDLTAHDVRRALAKLAEERSTRTMASTHNVLVRAHPTRRGERPRRPERGDLRQTATGEDRPPVSVNERPRCRGTARRRQR